MNSKTFFFRSGINCLIAKDPRSDEWHGFVGLDSDHPLHNRLFIKTNTVPLYKYNHINNMVVNTVWKRCTWFGFCKHPFSREKTLELLKAVADEIGSKDEEDDWESLFNLVKF